MNEEEKARRALEALRAEIREAHGVLKDLRQATKEAKEAFFDLTQEVLDERHAQGMEAITKAFEAASARGTEEILVRFQRIGRYLSKSRILPADAQLRGESNEDYQMFLAALAKAKER